MPENVDLRRTAENINILGNFCGKRSVDELLPGKLYEKFGIYKADVMVLFGGSILAGGDVLAKAMQDHVAEKYLIVGGAGHTTPTLRRMVHQEYPEIITDGLPEAEVFSRYLQTVYGCHADGLETASTNCGNNITYLLKMLEEQEIPCQSVILCQDATMQNRMEAGMHKYAPEKAVINYASYHACVTERNGELVFAQPIHGMWKMERYVNLLMGEIPRLLDQEDGYGPAGKGFIAHVEVPEEVQAAWKALQQIYGSKTREADPRFAS